MEVNRDVDISSFQENNPQLTTKVIYTCTLGGGCQYAQSGQLSPFQQHSITTFSICQFMLLGNKGYYHVCANNSTNVISLKVDWCEIDHDNLRIRSLTH